MPTFMRHVAFFKHITVKHSEKLLFVRVPNLAAAVAAGPAGSTVTGFWCNMMFLFVDPNPHYTASLKVHCHKQASGGAVGRYDG